MLKKLYKLSLLLIVCSLFIGFFCFKSRAAETLVWPVPGHTALSQGFHNGNAIDISDGSISGANVYAAMGGKVINIFLCTSQHYGSTGDCNGFGTGLVIQGTDGRIYQYAHMQGGSIPSNVYYGADVAKGQLIGKVGCTGNASGAHLHFGISYEKYWYESGINPSNETYTYTAGKWYASKNPVNIGDKVYATLLIKNTWIPAVDSNGKVVLATEERYDPYKMWRFERHPNGSYVIWNCGSERYLDITNLGDYDGATAKTTAYTGTALSWFIYDSGSGSYILRPNYSDRVLDVMNGQNKVGDILNLYTYNGSNAQLFAIYEFPKVGASSLSYTISDNSTTFNWSSATNATHYSLKINSGTPGNVSKYKVITNLTNTTYSLSLPAGYYEAYVDSCNWYCYNASNVIKFYVTKTQTSNTTNNQNSTTTNANQTTIDTNNNQNKTNTNTNITLINISKCNIILSKTSYKYTGKNIKPNVTVKYENKTLKKDVDYTVSYKNNKNVGTATIVITGKGKYTGSVTKTFKIIPKGTSLKKLTAGLKQFKATWNKQTTQTTGYQIQYSTNKNFKSGNKTVKVKKNKTTSSTVKKLKAKKKYYVRIRTYKTVNGKTYYSGWSKVKNVTTKK